MNLPKIGENRFKLAAIVAAGYPLSIVVWAGLTALGKTVEVGGILTALTVALLGVLASGEKESSGQ